MPAAHVEISKSSNLTPLRNRQLKNRSKWSRQSLKESEQRTRRKVRRSPGTYKLFLEERPIDCQRGETANEKLKEAQVPAQWLP